MAMSIPPDVGAEGAGGEGLSAGTMKLECDVNPFYTAMYKFQLRRWDDCIELCTQLLRKNPQDQAVSCYWSM